MGHHVMMGKGNERKNPMLWRAKLQLVTTPIRSAANQLTLLRMEKRRQKRPLAMLCPQKTWNASQRDQKNGRRRPPTLTQSTYLPIILLLCCTTTESAYLSPIVLLSFLLWYYYIILLCCTTNESAYLPPIILLYFTVLYYYILLCCTTANSKCIPFAYYIIVFFPSAYYFKLLFLYVYLPHIISLCSLHLRPTRRRAKP